MKISKSQCEKIEITDVKGLDPITVMLEDLGPSQGRITIMCWTEVWKACWGGMGERSISEFFCSCDEHYLSKNLSDIQGMVPDYDALEANAIKTVKQNLKDGTINEFEAGDLLDRIEGQFFNDEEARSASLYELLCDVYGHGDWVYEYPEKPNHEYQYLCRIINAVKDALKQSMAEAA